jgi:hypothetical protein
MLKLSKFYNELVTIRDSLTHFITCRNITSDIVRSLVRLHRLTLGSHTHLLREACEAVVAEV